MISRQQAHALNPVISKTISFQTLANVDSILGFIENKKSDLPNSLVNLIVSLVDAAVLFESKANDDPQNIH